ncbi:MAG: SDR family oxidoreductase [Proteobacteria bacterium]|nr:SDR family oxidoreductase [Pseudomonadota bacterium]
MHEPTVEIRLPGAVVLITGGARGIGAGIARAFLEAGATVLVCGRSTPADSDLPAAGGLRAQFIACDVRDAAAVEAMFAAVRERHGRLDVLVNNAGGSPAADLAAASPRLIERVIALNLTAPLLCAQAANRLMQAQARGGSVINIGSVAGERPSPGTTAYGAAKAGLLHATRSLAMELGPKVRVNAIITGFVATELTDQHYGGAAGVQRIAAMFPLRRLATAQDVASACLYLASPLAAYVSGALLAVHGGGEVPVFLQLARQPT